MNLELLTESIKYHEGYRLEPYRDHLNYWTVGYGHLIHNTLTDGDVIPLGSLLDQLSDPTQHEIWLQEDIDQAIADGLKFAGSLAWDQLNDVRQNVVIEMAFQLGLTRLNGFKKFAQALQRADYDQAAAEMVDSKWYRQTTQRATTLALEMRTGVAYIRGTNSPVNP